MQIALPGEFIAVYFRILGAILLIPYNFNLSGILGRGSLAFVFCLYFLSVNSGQNFPNQGLILNFLVGLTIGFSLLITFWSLLIVFEFTENMRGMNFALFFGSDDFASSQQLAQCVRIAVFVFFLQEGFLLQLMSQIQDSLLRIYDWQGLGGEIGGLALKSLRLGFLSLYPVIIIILMIQAVFLLLGKLYPSWSFFGEMFMAKILILLILCSGVGH